MGYEDLPDGETLVIADLSKPEDFNILSAHGVGYIIVHTKDYFPQKNPFDECQQRRIMDKPERVFEGFELVGKFEDGVVYRLL